jgi:hypothetical protein
MGVNYYIGCRDCKVLRDLDKLGPVYPQNIAEAKQAGKDLKEYNSALLIGFMVEHQGHNCTLFNDHADQDSIHNYSWEQKEFWQYDGNN